VLISNMDASSSGVQHLHYGTSMPPGGVHPIKSSSRCSSGGPCLIRQVEVVGDRPEGDLTLVYVEASGEVV
jgi:hypothetical protein